MAGRRFAACRDVGGSVRQEPSSTSSQMQRRLLERDFDFIERPSEDFFCPVSLELLLEPQLTSCCGHHLSLEAATRLQREGKPCPMCNGEGWSAMLDKYHRRRVHGVRVHCWHKENGCEWVGEVNELKRHADSCVKRPWECQYCARKCTYGEGEGKHWPTCPKFPEPCPNSCEVGSVERCNMEQHRSVCSLEPVACVMKEFGCSVVVPRKELATHMIESELQHLTAMTMLNLRLSRQLQQDSTERDRKITQLQQEMTEQKKLQTDVKMKMDEMHTKVQHQNKLLAGQTKMLSELKDHIQMERNPAVRLQQEMAEKTKLQTEIKMKMDTKFDEQRGLLTEQKRQLSELRGHIQRIEHTTYHLGQHAKEVCPGCEIITFTQCSRHISTGGRVISNPFYSHRCGYKFRLEMQYNVSRFRGTDVNLCLLESEYDDQLQWPMMVNVHLELLDQTGDRHNIVEISGINWTRSETNQVKHLDNMEILSQNAHVYRARASASPRPTPTRVTSYRSSNPTVKQILCSGGQYVVNDCLKFQIRVTVV